MSAPLPAISRRSLLGTLAVGAADFLSRPWRHTGKADPVAQMTIRDTYLGTAISAVHYEDWSKPFFPWTEARYSKYRNVGPAADDVAADVPQLTDAQAASYTIQNYFGDWHPHRWTGIACGTTASTATPL